MEVSQIYHAISSDSISNAAMSLQKTVASLHKRVRISKAACIGAELVPMEIEYVTDFSWDVYNVQMPDPTLPRHLAQMEAQNRRRTTVRKSKEKC